MDLELIENWRSYKNVDPVIADAALKGFQNHTWYLHPEMIPLALFDENLEDTKREALAQKILDQQDLDPDDGEQLLGRHGTGFGKPNLSLVNIEGKHLQDFVTSWRFFRIMEIST